MAIARGTAPVFRIGISNVTVASGYLVSTGADVDFSASSEKFPDADGETCGYLFYDHIKTATIRAYPAGSSASNANSANDFTASSDKLKPGKAITLTASTDNDINGDWVIMRSQKSRSTTERVTMTLTLEAPLTNRTAITTNEFTV